VYPTARAGAERVAIFEIGRVFLPPKGKEEKRLGLLFWGRASGATHWRSSSKNAVDFVDLKGALESVAPASLSFRRMDHRDLSLATEIFLDGKPIGLGGQLAASRATAVGASGAVLVAELQWDALSEQALSPRVFREIERFPAVTRDIALIVPETVTHEQIVRVVGTPAEPLLESVQLFDLFSGSDASNVGAARKSLAYRLTYRDRSRTLTSEEVTAAHAKIRERLQSELKAELRE
jgi:phenylalanyl-tRNA synthetase beta chain